LTTRVIPKGSGSGLLLNPARNSQFALRDEQGIVGKKFGSEQVIIRRNRAAAYSHCLGRILIPIAGNKSREPSSLTNSRQTAR
jgi:hypothetical protein